MTFFDRRSSVLKSWRVQIKCDEYRRVDGQTFEGVRSELRSRRSASQKTHDNLLKFRTLVTKSHVRQKCCSCTGAEYPCTRGGHRAPAPLIHETHTLFTTACVTCDWSGRVLWLFCADVFPMFIVSWSCFCACSICPSVDIVDPRKCCHFRDEKHSQSSIHVLAQGKVPVGSCHRHLIATVYHPTVILQRGSPSGQCWTTLAVQHPPHIAHKLTARDVSANLAKCESFTMP